MFVKCWFSSSPFVQLLLTEIVLKENLSLLLPSFISSIIQLPVPIGMTLQTFVLFWGWAFNTIYHYLFCCSKYPRYGHSKLLDAFLCILNMIPSCLTLLLSNITKCFGFVFSLADLNVAISPRRTNYFYSFVRGYSFPLGMVW